MDWRWVTVVLFAVSAGCAGLASDPTPTATPAPVPEIETTPTPEPGIAPGVTSRGVHDPDRLAEAHLDALSERSYVWYVEQTTSSHLANTTTDSNSSRVLRVEDERQYLFQTDTRDVRRDNTYRLQYNITEYTNGNWTSQQYFEPGHSAARYERTRATNATRAHGRTAAGYVTMFLDFQEATVVAVEYDGAQHYRITGERESIPELGAVSNASVEAVVSPDGFVRSLEATYRTVTGEHSQVSTYQYEYEGVGETSVERPTWVTDQWEETEQSADG